MSDVNDGGPAFPSVGEGFGNPSHSAPGMTLRDWFAGQALAGLVTKYARSDTEALVVDCYECADAMLKAREVKS
jgi:hypothetical protein